jgi:uncharacterized protein
MNVYIAQSKFGRGIFAARNISAGEKILEYVGHIISQAEIIARGDTGNPLQIDDDAYLDLKPPGIFTNHSCQPNAGIKQDRWLVALTAIKTGEEIYFDYSTSMWEDIWTMECACESVQCRKIIRDFYLLPEALQQHYLQATNRQNVLRAARPQLTGEPPVLHSNENYY